MSFKIEEVLYALYHFPMALTAPFISWYFFFGLSERDFIGSGLIIAIPYFFLIFSTGFFGRLSDKFGSKNLVLISLGTLSVSFLCYFFIQDKLLFFILYIGFNVIISGFTPAFNRLMSFYEENERAAKFGRLGMMASVGFLVGSVFASLAFALNASGNSIETFRAMFPIAMFISLFTFVSAFKLKETTYTNRSQTNISHSNVGQTSTSEIKPPMKPILILLVLIALINSSSSIYVNFFSIFIQDELNQNISFIALANSIATLFGVFVTYFVGKSANMFKRKPFVLLATFLYTLFPLSIFLLRDPLIIFILYCLPFYAILFVIAPVFISENSLESGRGQIMGLYIGSQYFGLLIGTMMGAFLAAANDIVSPNFLGGTLIGLFSIFICFFFFEEASDEVQAL
ncbi:MAG: MFS transporter [Candidatus Heimdallarchaeota archaeon]|nr:MAG: MFS transporter [Candidatus Heimdallarchaeota archaeon]